MVIAESIAVAALGWVASPLVGKLLNEGFKSLGINADKKLKKKMQNILPVLKSVIEKAEGSAHQSEVEDWLQRLKDAYDDAEDALDLLIYRRLEHEVANRVRSPFRVPKPLKWIMPILKGCRDIISLRKIKLRRMLKKLEKIIGEALKLRDLLGAQSDQTATKADIPEIALPPPEVFGRNEDREEIIRRLKTDPEDIIAIVGRPGVGKTTLAQYVCKQLESELNDSKHFHPVIWVHASHNFSASEIMKEIIRQASIASEPQDPVNPDDLPAMILCKLGTNVDTNVDTDSPEVLRQKMNKKLNKKRFLLVIDDVWCDGEDHKKNWDTLFRCLSECCSPGSKILVTSQRDDAPRNIVATKGATGENIYHLKELEENDILDLFIHHALPSRKIDSSLRKDFEEGCKKIAEKLNKDPTAAKIVGETIALNLADLLRSKGDWRTYLRTIAEKDWSGSKTKALMWSYQHLPGHLQRCFSYCSLYPRGYKFRDLQLVHLWMAQGFIKPDNQDKRIEEVGYDYLKELVSRFYIQSHDSYYTLHELLCDLAEKVSRNDCVRIEGNRQSEITSTIRHLWIPANKLKEKKEEICKLKKLRTLIVAKGERVISEESDTSEENVATYIFNSLKKLRVLVLELNLEYLAKFIGEMKHLRVLRVFGPSKFVLPESVCSLYLLQVLKVDNASSLPKHLNNLVNLRHLQPYDKTDGMADIGRLTSLQGLGKFHVPKEKGYELEQLQNLNELRGSLHIDNLENVESKNSAIAANLTEKKYLDELKLEWHDGEDNVNSSLDVEILEGLLQLPPNLTRLYLIGYRGQLWPTWQESQTSNIQELVLEQCKMLEELPPMDQLYPSCRRLYLRSLPKLKALHTLPPRLQKISIIGTLFLTFATNEDLQMSPDEKRSIIEVMRKTMPEWFLRQHRQKSLVDNEKEMRNFIAVMNDSNNEASSADDMDITAVWERWLGTYEQKMELIYNIQNEAKLLLPSTLTKLYLDGCNITDHALSACLQTLTSLTALFLRKIRTITCLPSEDVLGKLKALQSLQIWWCWALTSLGGIRSLPCLTHLFLHECPCLDSKSTASLPPSLEAISFARCANVEVILANADFPRLSCLVISHCHMLKRASLQFGNLPSLRLLIIWRCHGLSFLVNVQELHSLEDLSLGHLRLKEVMNFPRSLKCLEISDCPILERSINIDPLSGIRTLGGIPVSTIPENQDGLHSKCHLFWLKKLRELLLL